MWKRLIDTEVAQSGFAERATSAALVELSVGPSHRSIRGNRAQARSSQSDLGANSIQLRLTPVSGVTGGLPLYPQPRPATDLCSDRPCGRYAVFDSRATRDCKPAGMECCGSDRSRDSQRTRRVLCTTDRISQCQPQPSCSGLGACSSDSTANRNGLVNKLGFAA